MNEVRRPYVAVAFDALRDLKDVLWVWERDELETGKLPKLVKELEQELKSIENV